jgi:hypothetical protein
VAPTIHRSRIHLLAARQAPVIVILQRKRTRLYHVITLDTETHAINEGSWFRGKLDALCSDVSFDGKFMVYQANGAGDRTQWSGVCRLPWLKTLFHVDSAISSGGYFSGPNNLTTRYWFHHVENIFSTDDIPFTIERDNSVRGHGRRVIDGRFERDGFVRLGDNWGVSQMMTSPPFLTPCIGDDGWGRRPAPGYPELQVRYLGITHDAYSFGFTLDEFPGLLRGAMWATWDASNNLWVARPGVVEQYTLDDIKRGTPSFSLDVDRFEPPPKPIEEAS